VEAVAVRTPEHKIVAVDSGSRIRVRTHRIAVPNDAFHQRYQRRNL
jgi:hypothetical protein